MADRLTGKTVVIAPHSDDAVLSLGAAIARGVHDGAAVHVLTVLAGDPDSTIAASDWDRRCGFSTAGESARARRDEDRRACGLIGASVAWLPYGYSAYELGGTEEEVWEAVREACSGADAAVLPGFPLVHPDHLWLTELLLRRGLPCPIGLYVEQPYAFRRRRRLKPQVLPPLLPLVTGGIRWRHLPATAAQRRLKWSAVRAYRTQLRSLHLSPVFGLRLERMLLYEHRIGGEVIAWLGDENSAVAT